MSENAPGGASSDSTDSDKDFSCDVCGKQCSSSGNLNYHIKNSCPEAGEECPTCGKICVSEAGVSMHHAREHGESLSKITLECEYCSEEFDKYQSESGGGRGRYCSESCKYSDFEDSRTGKGNHNWKGGKEIAQCLRCGTEFECHTSNDRKYCSLECVGKRNAEARRKRVELKCDWCNGVFSRIPARVNESVNFCSGKCSNEYQSEVLVGEDNHMYNGGREDGYGPNWDEQAEKCRERDGYTCQLCGLHQDDHWRKLTAHHLIPRKEFIDDDGNYDWERGNKLENLLTVCSHCHQSWEGIPLRPT